MKILCTADIHIGRRSSRLTSLVGDERRFSAAQAWVDIVELALNQNIDLLLLAGDVVDQDNRYFEAYGPLEAGLRRLADNGVQTLAVAGNHDTDVLPRLAQDLGSDSFRLLGAGGSWERHIIAPSGRPLLNIDGWSFPSRYVSHNPLVDYPGHEGNGAPVIVMLHADLDNANSRYAPISQADFERHEVDFWLLGHIHQSRQAALSNGTHVLYPGSPLALDPGEKGAHGPWLLEMSDRSFRIEQLLLSRVRYEELTISLDGVASETDFQTRISNDLNAQLAVHIDDPVGLEAVCLRLKLVGRTNIPRQLRMKLGNQLIEDYRSNIGTAIVYVEKLEDEVRPDIDLHALARESSPPGILARLMLALESGELNQEERDLLRTVQAKLRDVHGARPYLPLSAIDLAPDEMAAQVYLRQAGWDLLNALITQQESA